MREKSGRILVVGFGKMGVSVGRTDCHGPCGSLAMTVRGSGVRCRERIYPFRCTGLRFQAGHGTHKCVPYDCCGTFCERKCRVGGEGFLGAL